MTSKKMSEGFKRLQLPLKILAMQCSPPPWFFIRTRVIIINNINIKIQTIVPITAFKSEFSLLNRAFSLTNPKSLPISPASPTSCSPSFPRKLWMPRTPPCLNNSKSWHLSSRPQRFQIQRTRRQRQQRQRPWASTVSKWWQTCSSTSNSLPLSMSVVLTLWCSQVGPWHPLCPNTSWVKKATTGVQEVRISIWSHLSSNKSNRISKCQPNPNPHRWRLGAPWKLLFISSTFCRCRRHRRIMVRTSSRIIESRCTISRKPTCLSCWPPRQLHLNSRLVSVTNSRLLLHLRS